MITWIQSFYTLLFPRYCPVCGDILHKGDCFVCIKCNIDMPRTNFHLVADNRMEKLLWGRIDIERATAYFYYTKGTIYRKLLHLLKYKNEEQLGFAMGQCMAGEISDSGFFDSIDCLIPVPLHPKKHKKRGYNQSELIAQGISYITGIPVETNHIIRCKNTETQTLKSNYDRMESMENVFRLSGSCNCSGKHILLVDDILTTGATIVACGSVLQKSQNDVKVSVLTLGFVQ